MIHLKDNMRLNESIFELLNFITPIASHSESKQTAPSVALNNLITSLIKSSDAFGTILPILYSCILRVSYLHKYEM